MIKLFSGIQLTKANKKICTLSIIKLDHMDCVYSVIRRAIARCPYLWPYANWKTDAGVWVMDQLKGVFKIRC